MKLKQIVGVMLAAVITFGGVAGDVYAAEVTSGVSTGNSVVQDDTNAELYSTTEVPWSYQGATAVKYSNSEYDADVIVTIPKEVILDETKSGTYDVAVKGHIEHALGVQVKPHDDLADVDGVNFNMSTEGKNDVVATVTQAEDVWKFEEVTAEGTAKSGTISAPDLSRGDWTGTLTFDIRMDEEFGIVCDKSDLTDPKHTFGEDGVCPVCGAVKEVTP